MRHIKRVIRIYPKRCYQYHDGRKSGEITVTPDHFRFDDKNQKTHNFHVPLDNTNEVIRTYDRLNLSFGSRLLSVVSYSYLLFY